MAQSFGRLNIIYSQLYRLPVMGQRNGCPTLQKKITTCRDARQLNLCYARKPANPNRLTATVPFSHHIAQRTSYAK